jgi:hypothetical protein
MKEKHSGLAISSFVGTIISIIGLSLSVAVAGYLEVTTEGGVDEESVEAILLGLVLFFFMFLSLVSVGLAIAGTIQKTKKRLFAIISLSLAVPAFLVVVGLMLVGMSG